MSQQTTPESPNSRVLRSPEPPISAQPVAAPSQLRVIAKSKALGEAISRLHEEQQEVDRREAERLAQLRKVQSND